MQPAPDCEGEGWAEVDRGGYACLERALVSDGPARTQPELPEGRLLPFIYAKPRVLDRKTEAIASVPRYRDHLAFRRGEQPLDFLAPDRQYAFLKERKRNGRVTLVDDDDRVVPLGEPGVRLGEPLGERDLRLPAEQFARLGHICPVRAHIRQVRRTRSASPGRSITFAPAAIR